MTDKGANTTNKFECGCGGSVSVSVIINSSG